MAMQEFCVIHLLFVRNGIRGIQIIERHIANSPYKGKPIGQLNFLVPTTNWPLELPVSDFSARLRLFYIVYNEVFPTNFSWFYDCLLCWPRTFCIVNPTGIGMLALHDKHSIFKPISLGQEVKISYLTSFGDECSEKTYHYRKYSQRVRNLRSYCSDEKRGIHLLITYMNFTPKPVQSRTKFLNASQFGQLYTEFSFRHKGKRMDVPDVNDSFVLSTVRLSGAAGYPIIYCDHEPKGIAKAGVLVWVSPIQGQVWVVLLLAIGGACALAENNRGAAGVFFLFIRFILRQWASKRRNYLILTAGLGMMFTHCYYENLITSSLIVTPTHQRILTVKDFFNLGYQLAYSVGCDIDINVAIKKDLLDELRIVGVRGTRIPLMELNQCQGTVDTSMEVVGTQKGKKGLVSIQKHAMENSFPTDGGKDLQSSVLLRRRGVWENVSVPGTRWRFSGCLMLILNCGICQLIAGSESNGRKIWSFLQHFEGSAAILKDSFNTTMHCDGAHCLHEVRHEYLMLMNLEPLFMICLIACLLSFAIFCMECMKRSSAFDVHNVRTLLCIKYKN